MKLTTCQRRRLDHEWSLAIRGRDSDACFICGSMIGVAAHHMLYRGNKIARYDVRNGICLCLVCHFAIDGGRDTSVSAYLFDRCVKHLEGLYNFKWEQFSQAARTSQPLPGGPMYPDRFAGINYAPRV